MLGSWLIAMTQHPRAAAQPEHEPLGTDLPSELKTLVAVLGKVATAAGVGGVFGVIGWYVQTSQDNLFGIRSELASNFVTTYLLLFSQFIIDCLRVLLDWHAVTVLVAAFLLALVVLFHTRWQAKLETLLKSHLVLAACLLLVLVSAWATYFVMPSFLLSDLLFENAGKDHYFDVGLVASIPTQQTWNEMIESRPTSYCGSQNASQWKLESRFASSLMLLAFCWWFGIVVLRFHFAQGRDLAGLQIVILFALIGSTLLVPYMYGKLILPTCFPSATVIFKPGSAEDAEIAYEAERGQPQKPDAATQTKDAVQKKAVENAAKGFANFLLVREYPDKFILYYKKTRSIWPVLKSNVSAIQIGPREDLLALKFEGS
jgi:hypothetical protein